MTGNLGEAIRSARVAKGLSQDGLATLAKVSRKQVSLVENGANVSVDFLEKVVRALEMRELPLGGVKLRIPGQPDVDASEVKLLVDLAHQAVSALRDRFTVVYDAPATSQRLRLVANDAPQAPDIFTMDLPENAPFRVAAVEELLDGEMVAVDGYVAAGPNGLDYTPRGDNVYLPRHLLPGKGEKVLIAKGDSMVDVGIQDGDIVVVQPRRGGVAARGEIIIAWYNGGIVVKEWWRDRSGKYLVSHNPEIPRIKLEEGDVFDLQAIVRRSITPSWKVRDHSKISG
jgi:SOS-response transcriptional repressor LexA/DNA-binding XRE family transcriptional regulator